MNTSLKRIVSAVLFALSFGFAHAHDAAPQQFLVTVSISHSGHLVAEGPLIFYAGPADQTVNTAKPMAQYASLAETGYPAIRCSHVGGTTTRDFRTVMLKSGYTMAARLNTQQQKIAITIQRFDAEGATDQVLAEMKKPIQVCRSIEPRQVVSLTQTVTVPATAGTETITLKNGDALRCSVATATP
jgi:hypothetical protein